VDDWKVTPAVRMIHPTPGVMLMARAHWETLSDERKNYNLVQSQRYLLTAIHTGAWPEEEKHNGKKT
jgi:hypothetical protein